MSDNKDSPHTDGRERTLLTKNRPQRVSGDGWKVTVVVTD